MKFRVHISTVTKGNAMSIQFKKWPRVSGSLLDGNMELSGCESSAKMDVRESSYIRDC